MKLKILLLATSALLPFSLANAKEKSLPKKQLFDSSVNIVFGGEINFQSGIRHQKKDFIKRITPNNNSSIAFNSDSSVHASIHAKSESGWKYGAQLGIMTNTLSDDPAGSDILDRTYLYIEKDTIGRFEAGGNKSAANTMKITGGSVAAATGGAWSNYITLDRHSDAALNNQIIFGDNFLSSSKLVLKEGSLEEGSHERYRKVTYYSPKYNGFQLGLSFGPDTENRGVLPFPPFNGKKEGKLKNAVSGSIKWEGNVNDGKDYIAFAIAGEHAKKQQPSDVLGTRMYNPVYAVMVGGTYKHGNVSVAASYANHFKSNFEKIAGLKNTFVCDFGLGYDFGKANASINYVYSSKNNNPLHAVTVGADYDLAPGILPYAEVTYVRIHQKAHYDENKSGNQATLSRTDFKNSGIAYILGTKITF